LVLVPTNIVIVIIYLATESAFCIAPRAIRRRKCIEGKVVCRRALRYRHLEELKLPSEATEPAVMAGIGHESQLNPSQCKVSAMRESNGTAVLHKELEERAERGTTVNGGVPLSRVQLSIVVTVFSEKLSIRETVDTLFARDRGYIKEIILVVSPRASEESFAICRECAGKEQRVSILVQKTNPGVGWAYREGMQAATGNFVALMAADLETEPAAVDRMVEKILQTGCDGVIANRWLPGGGFTNYDPIKYVLNWTFQKFFKLLFWTNLSDLTFGFKILSKQITDSIDWQGTLHEICIETTVKPIKQGYHLEQIPSTWVGRKEGSSVNTFLKNFRYVEMAFKTLFAGR
jgi:dolichol-phosphate mannosyltransferase